jgi:uncharacterized membrane protein YgcG
MPEISPGKWLIDYEGESVLVVGANSDEDAIAIHLEAINPPLTEANYADAIQSHVDSIAKSRGYRDGFALAGYVSSTITTWAAEAAAFIAWRDSVWVYVYQEFAKVQNGEREQPTIAGLIAELPTIQWP